MNNEHPLSLIQFAQQQLAQFGRAGATRIVNVPALSTPVPISGSSQAPLLTWRDPGTVIALYGQELTGTVAKFASTALRLQFPGDEDFITNGSAGDFASLLALVGPNTNWFPMIRRVRRGDNWIATYRNDDAAATATPAISFAFIADADLERVERDMREAHAARGR
jgi:hypothetical protein